mmetsp:Transcript_9199/g.22092  ORF Transcript_9199/g.22092 Transcript_9199/m.22092 type:complete len:149 (+) Transcript_9199:57-503(+)
MASILTLVLLMVAAVSATRVGQSEDLQTDLRAPQQGEKCDCHEKEWYEQRSTPCCGDGLVCSRESGTCELALGATCKSQWIKSQCEGKGTYHVETKCGDSVCCIKKGTELKYPAPYKAEDQKFCCGGKATKDFRYNKKGREWYVDVCE